MVKKLFLKLRNIIIGNWRNLTGYQSDETKRNNYDYKLNVEGNQVAYQYEVVTKREVDFDWDSNRRSL